MTGLTDEQREIAALLFSLPQAGGYVLAGGAALVALRLVERTTRDLDAFLAARAGRDPGSVEPLMEAAAVALVRAGWDLVVVRRHATFCRFVVTRDEYSVEIDLAIDSPPLQAVEVVDGIPVLSSLDLAGRKILATLDRAEARDFTDLWSLSRALGRTACVDAARQLDGAVEAAAVRSAFANIERLADAEFPVASDEVEVVRSWFKDWRDELAGS
ncbi:MAG: nucleotidyl transferase AbiEii/AbiGii toxin family protein [Acidimicrobiales bacterium]